MKRKKKPNIRKMVSLYGYEGAKRKLRIMGYNKAEVFRLTAFLFK